MAEKKNDKPTLGTDCNERSPGPGAYMLPTLVGYKGHAANKNRGPRFTMRPKTGEYADTKGPGPQYDSRGMTRFGRDKMPPFTLRKRLPPPKPNDFPGPGTYAPEKFQFPRFNRPPAYTMKSRLRGLRKDNTPAPNLYVIPTCIGPRRPHVESLPEYSLRPALPALKRFMTPGPPDYGIPSLNFVKPRVPQVKMVKPSGRVALPESACTAAPCDYYPLYDTTANRPKYAFGVKHSPCAPPYITPADNEYR